MNIQLNYRYRDGANYKQNHSEIFSNQERLPLQQVEDCIKLALIDEMWFYADKWKLKDLHQYQWDNEIDHEWHEHDSIEETEEAATKGDIADFLELIKKVN